jgi:hypothetical protein
LKSASPALRQLISQGDHARWFKHPYNQNSTLPYFASKPNGSIDVFHTASRSLALRIGNEYYTLKMGTDHPHGLERDSQQFKAFTKEDVLDGANRMAYFERVDLEIGMDPNLIIAKKVAIISEKSSNENYLFHNLSFIKNKNFYLPTFSIPFAGQNIAHYNGMTPETFWQSAYIEILGRSKAKLLLRYGAQMETPNAQNMLIELNPNLKPTDRLVFQNISDTMLVRSVVEGLEEKEVLKQDEIMGVKNTENLMPGWYISTFNNFDYAGEHSFSKEIIEGWEKAHDRAYLQEIGSALKLDLSQFQKLDGNMIDGNLDFNAFMSSDIVQQKLRQYRKTLKEKNRNSGIGRLNAI